MPRTGVVNVVFAVVFGLVAALAAATAAGTTDSWFSVEVSSLVFPTYIFATIVTAFVLFGFAATHVARLEDARRSIDLRIATIPESIHLPTGAEVTITPDIVRTIPPSDEEVDELLTTLATPTATSMPQGEIAVAGTLVEISVALQATRTRKEVLRVLIRERIRVESDRRRVAGTVAGPIVVALLSAGMAGAMLPGVQGFAQTNFQLTTGVVLFLAYGLAFLVAWALAALASLVRRAPEPRNGDWPERLGNLHSGFGYRECLGHDGRAAHGLHRDRHPHLSVGHLRSQRRLLRGSAVWGDVLRGDGPRGRLRIHNPDRHRGCDDQRAPDVPLRHEHRHHRGRRGSAGGRPLVEDEAGAARGDLVDATTLHAAGRILPAADAGRRRASAFRPPTVGARIARDPASRRRAAHRDRPRHRRKRIRHGRDGGPPGERRECGDPASRRGGEQPVDRAGAAPVRVRRDGGARGGVPQWPSRAAGGLRGTAGDGASHVADPMKHGSNRRCPSSHSLG